MWETYGEGADSNDDARNGSQATVEPDDIERRAQRKPGAEEEERGRHVSALHAPTVAETPPRTSSHRSVCCFDRGEVTRPSRSRSSRQRMLGLERLAGGNVAFYILGWDVEAGCAIARPVETDPDSIALKAGQPTRTPLGQPQRNDLEP